MKKIILDNQLKEAVEVNDVIKTLGDLINSFSLNNPEDVKFLIKSFADSKFKILKDNNEENSNELTLFDTVHDSDSPF